MYCTLHHILPEHKSVNHTLFSHMNQVLLDHTYESYITYYINPTLLYIVL